MNKRLIDFSKEISYALRHNPWLYGLEMDCEGYVPLEQLIAGINAVSEHETLLSLDDIYAMDSTADKKRWELRDNRIRALYGHSIPIEKQIGTPPSILYHGTSHDSIPLIFERGLLPMKRQYVHLSVDTDMAIKVGRRRDPNPLILKINTSMAIKNGVHFYVGNDKIWLSDVIPPVCLVILTE